MFILLLLVLPVFVYGFRAALPEKQEFSKLAKVTRIIFISFFLFFGLLLLAQKSNYYLIGYRSSTIVYLLVSTAGIIYALSDLRFILNSFKRILLNLIALAFMGGMLIVSFELIGDFQKQFVFADSKYRLEFDGRGPMSACGLPALFVKSGLVERKYLTSSTDTCFTKENISKVLIRHIDSSYLVTYFLVAQTDKEKQIQLDVQYKKLLH